MNETLALAGVIGYIIGDGTAPVRRSVQTALLQMRRATRQDVNDGEGNGQNGGA